MKLPEVLRPKRTGMEVLKGNDRWKEGESALMQFIGTHLWSARVLPEGGVRFQNNSPDILYIEVKDIYGQHVHNLVSGPDFTDSLVLDSLFSTEEGLPIEQQTTIEVNSGIRIVIRHPEHSLIARRTEADFSILDETTVGIHDGLLESITLPSERSKPFRINKRFERIYFHAREASVEETSPSSQYFFSILGPQSSDPQC